MAVKGLKLTRDQACGFFGGKRGLAEAIGVTEQTVARWPADKELAPQWSAMVRLAMIARAMELENESAMLREVAGL